MCVLTPPSQRERAEKQPLSDRLGRCELSARPGMRGERRKERRNDRWIERGGAIKTEREREGEGVLGAPCVWTNRSPAFSSCSTRNRQLKSLGS